MKKLGLTLVVFAALVNGNNSGVTRPITVITVNYAHAPGETLSEAQGIAGEIFQDAGVEVEWITPEETGQCEECAKRLGQSMFFVRIVPDSMISGFADGHDHIGYAIIPANGAPGYIAGAYFGRVNELATRLGCKASLVLGSVIAHEVGHLLLGAGSHGRSGIMAYGVSGDQMRLAAQARLLFSRSEVERLHRNTGKEMAR